MTQPKNPDEEPAQAPPNDDDAQIASKQAQTEDEAEEADGADEAGAPDED